MKLHTVTVVRGRPLRLFTTAGQVSDYTGARTVVGSLPSADWLLGNRGYDADWFREALTAKRTKPCIQSRRSRDKLIRYGKCRCKRRNSVVITFGRLKD